MDTIDRCHLIIAFFPLSLIYLAFESEDIRREISDEFVENYPVYGTIVALAVAYQWFPKTVTFIVALIIGIVGYFENSRERSFIKNMAMFLLFAGGMVFAFNLISWNVVMARAQMVTGLELLETGLAGIRKFLQTF